MPRHLCGDLDDLHVVLAVHLHEQLLLATQHDGLAPSELVHIHLNVLAHVLELEHRVEREVGKIQLSLLVLLAERRPKLLCRN